jgi:hypothetical protein
MNKILLSLALAFAISPVFCQQDATAIRYGQTITEKDLYKHLSVIASDALQGRGTGTVGQRMAATYIAEHFKSIGLKGPVVDGENSGFYQDVKLYSLSPHEIYLNIKKGKYQNFRDIIYYGSSNTNGVVNRDIIFAGAGTESDFESLDVKDKAVMIMSESDQGWRLPTKIAEEKGAKVVIVIRTSTDEEFESLINRYEKYSANGDIYLEKPETPDNDGIIFIKPSLAGKIFNTTTEKLKEAIENKKRIKPSRIVYELNVELKEIVADNVLGYLEGTDKKDELLVVTSHYDHLGMVGEDIYNGADDDGSGTVALMELAEAFSEAKKAGFGPRRSILFMAVTGEEIGLFGSEFYTTHPIFPLKNTIVDLNIDMVGRIDTDHKVGDNFVSLVGSDKLSSELHEISEHANSTYTKMDLDYTYNDENHPEQIYYRSDHWSFAKNNIPVIFYTTGTHPDYHKPTDTIEKINFDLLKKRTELVFYTAWELANRDKRIVVDKIDVPGTH